MVKHDAKDQEPIVTAEERVTRAVDKLIANNKFTAEQLDWISLIHEHLIRNLSLSEEDFDLVPLLQNRGGKARARRVFQNAFPSLLATLNYSVAA